MDINIKPRRFGSRLAVCKGMLADLKLGKKTILAVTSENHMETFQLDMLKLTDELIVYDLISSDKNKRLFYYEITLV